MTLPTATERAFVFEVDPTMGTPRLQVVPGVRTTWTPKEQALLEDQIRPRYDKLTRDGHGTFQFKGSTVSLKKLAGDTSRLPTLEVFVPAAVVVRPPDETPVMPVPAFRTTPSSSLTGWPAGLLAELDHLLNSDRIPAPEKAMLRVVLDELGGLAGRASSREVAVWLFTAVVSLADQLERAKHPSKASHYAVALDGLQGLTEPGALTPWGGLPVGPPPAPPTWFGRFWTLLTGE